MILLGKALCKWCLDTADREETNNHHLSWHLRLICPQTRDAGLYPRPFWILLSEGETSRTPLPLYLEKQAFCFQDMPLSGVHNSLKSQKQKQKTAPKIPRGWILIFSLTMGNKMKSSFLRQLDTLLSLRTGLTNSPDKISFLSLCHPGGQCVISNV